MKANDALSEKGEWQYLLVNGPGKWVLALNPKFEKGVLTSIDGLNPFDEKDTDGNPKKATFIDAEKLKRLYYVDFFKKSFKNLIILAGAGSSVDVGGPLMHELWTEVESTFKRGEVDGFKLIREKIGYKDSNKDLEALLSHVDGYLRFVKDEKVIIGKEELSISFIREIVFTIIKTKCSISKPIKAYPHKVFLEKLLQRKQTNPRIKVFTLNYDLLFEYAATDVNAIVIDGFSFTFPRTFSGRFFDYDIVQREGSKLEEEDNFVQRVFHLHKLHGSLNWERIENDVVIKEKPTKPLLVYPREAKYEDSYDQPFFEMMARFQRSLRMNNDTLLISVGYSFNDRHINAAIEEALNQNPSFRLAVVCPEFDNENVSLALKRIRADAKIFERVIMISERFEEFSKYFPEIKTYDSENYVPINLKDERSKD